MLAPVNYAVGGTPVAVVAADLNGDGLNDLAVANRDPNLTTGSVAVLLNNNGDFAPAIPAVSGSAVSTLLPGDFNGDGVRDLAFTTALNTTLSVLLGVGDGSFQSPRTTSLDAPVVDLTVRDFDGDGYDDVAVGRSFPSAVSVYHGLGTGLFHPPQDYSLTGSTLAVASGDVNGDGILDLVTVNDRRTSPPAAPGVTVLLGQGDGTFAVTGRFAIALPMGEARLAVGELHADGKLDLVVKVPSGVFTLRGDGDGSFQAPISRYADAMAVASMTVADLNADGRDDLALARTGFGHVATLVSNGDDTFQPLRRTDAGNSPSAVIAADLDWDGLIDLAVTNAGSQDVSVRRGRGDGTFDGGQSLSTPPNPIGLVAQDFNRDGPLDLATVNGAAGASIFLNQADGTFAGARNFPVQGYAADVAAADFNGDNRPDLVAATTTGNALHVLIGNGDGTFQTARVLPLSGAPHSVQAADLNGDGRIDLAVTIRVPDSLSLFLGNGDGTFQAPRALAAEPWPTKIALDDFNQDGILDAAITLRVGRVSVYLGEPGGGYQNPRTFEGGGLSLDEIRARDFNGDGNPDLVLTREDFVQTPGAVSVFLGNGDGTFLFTQHFAEGPISGALAVGDFDGDGVLDLVVGVRSGVKLLRGNGDGTFQADHRSYGAASFLATLVAADLDGDGRLDFAFTRAFTSPTVALLYGASCSTPGSAPGGRHGAGQGIVERLATERQPFAPRIDPASRAGSVPLGAWNLPQWEGHTLRTSEMGFRSMPHLGLLLQDDPIHLLLADDDFGFETGAEW